MYHLSKVVDTHGIKPKFTGTSIKYTQPDTMFRGFKAKVVQKIWDNKIKASVIVRTHLTSWNDFNGNNVYLKTTKSSKKTDTYLESLGGSFITLEKMDDENLEKEYLGKEQVNLNLSDNVFNDMVKNLPILHKALQESKEIKDYDAIVVPDDFGKTFDEEEEITVAHSLTAAERRKLEEKIVVQYLAPRDNIKWEPNAKIYVWKQRDTKVSDIQEDEATICYGFAADEKQMHFLGLLMDRGGNGIFEDFRFYNENIKLIKINKTNERHFRGDNCFHVTEFFQKTRNINE